ncbi:transmembrane protein, putative (macronuclear) [Tetrahymena thermophila SB210]|uniref:Transmembrane protein, putative n=1 Tax=Tetrahymena thermophila (strain SB210) TaxID=312017 RepID=W7XH28_TETTS|nr:transmembrane protein, putative [Tetrahymena thermophila SB210]EWS76428.1 transmembrane protein, putative [Tetrahymena thermophila SB210]|eukprot:XP_012651052.1 transmembrane protein, putative [Tetrahymena thermophila SB210]
MTIDQYQQSLNQTYLVYVVQLYYQDPTNNTYNTINLNTFQCTTPQLQGFRCIDFSNVGNYTFLLDNNNNNQIYSSIYIHMYGCRDQDFVKTTVPDNCPAQTDIDNVINGQQAYFQLKLKTQQYNTNSQEIQTTYRNIYNYAYSPQFVLNSLSAQKQETQVDLGLLFQQRQTYSSPIQYTQTTQNFDRNSSLALGLGPYKILALVNAVAGLIVVFRILGKFYSQKLIKQDFFMLMLQNLYQDKYKNIIIHNNLINNQENISSLISTEKTQKDEVEDEIQENCLKRDIIVPDFPTKLRDYVEKSQSPILNDTKNCQYLLKFNDQINEENEKTENQKNSINNNDLNNYVINSPNEESINKKFSFPQVVTNQQNEQNEQSTIKDIQLNENYYYNTYKNQLLNSQNKIKLNNLLCSQQISSQRQLLSSPKMQNKQKSASVFQSRSQFNNRSSINIANRVIQVQNIFSVEGDRI